MIVVDVGCHPWLPEESVHRLIDRFCPDVLFGFDPHPDVVEGIEVVRWTADRDGWNGARFGSCAVVRRRVAAWTQACQVPLYVDGIRTGVHNVSEALPLVPAIDLPGFLAALPTGVVLKLDAEGAEYVILPELRRRDLDLRLALILVEWHPPETSHGRWVGERPELRCPVEEW